jgi:hypothetical protein
MRTNLTKYSRLTPQKFFGVNVIYTPARNAVKLYRLPTLSVIPERGNKPTVATGLLAIPDTAGTSFFDALEWRQWRPRLPPSIHARNRN